MAVGPGLVPGPPSPASLAVLYCAARTAATPLAIAAAAISYLSVFFPAIGQIAGLPAVLTCAAVWLFTAINCRGVREAGAVQMVTTGLKLLPLLAVMVLAVLLLLKLALLWN